MMFTQTQNFLRKPEKMKFFGVNVLSYNLYWTCQYLSVFSRKFEVGGECIVVGGTEQ